jgi:hypothetical protein
MSNLEYKFEGFWNTFLEKRIVEFIQQKWQEWENEEADTDFTQCFIDLIKGQKSMNQILNELKDLRMETDKAM